MGVFTSIDLKTLNEIFSFYHLGKVENFRATQTGISNSNFWVQTDSSKEFLLKISNDKTLEQLSAEQEILSILEKLNYPYSLRPLALINGERIYQHQSYFGVIFPFVQGGTPEMTKDNLVQIAQAQAMLHLLPVTREKDHGQKIRCFTEVGFGGLNIVDYVATPTCPEDFKNSWLSIFPNGLSFLPLDEFPQGLIHGDLYYDNSLFRDGRLVTLIDFEQSGIGRFILDLGIAIGGSCLQGELVDQNLLDVYLQSYEKIRPLNQMESSFLPHAIVVGLFSIALWRIKRFYEGNLDYNRRYNYRQLLNRAKEFAAHNL